MQSGGTEELLYAWRNGEKKAFSPFLLRSDCAVKADGRTRRQSAANLWNDCHIAAELVTERYYGIMPNLPMGMQWRRR